MESENQHDSAKTLSEVEAEKSLAEPENTSPAVQEQPDPASTEESKDPNPEESKDAAPAKKKKKRNRKKPAKESAAPVVATVNRFQDNSHIRLLKNWNDNPNYMQTNPPSIPISQQFPNNNFPIGEICEYSGDNAYRATSEEKRELERLHSYDYEALRKGAEAHRQIRRWAQSVLKPGLDLHDFCEELENYSRVLLEGDGIEAGVGFPTGCSLNYVAAHFTPNPGDKVTLGYDDVCKVDFGTHVGGRIIDCAFTVAFNPKFDNLVHATQDATNEGVKHAGVDARFSEIGGAIQEALESYEIELDGRTYPIKAIRNLNGHSIGPFHIHGGKSVQIVKNNDQTKMEEGELYAIETFGSTGKGLVHDDLECSHYMIDFDLFGKPIPLRDNKARGLLRHIEKKYGTLPWSRRQLQRDGETKHILPLRNLVNAGIVVPYPPLCDVRGSYVSQMEHTFIIRPTCKEVLSRGDDF
ncbi:unnamed protein product [Blepharisma stoltei]|uniref:Methionine aminopeptidase 2 n=1 Tax=Blepharisma stoltei TaxID=1481888 RepID=A0AAU9KDM1_9CILI|nr:unnamed protein product [Blepharisma stoltei]